MHVPEKADASSFHGTWGYAALSGKSRGKGGQAFTDNSDEAIVLCSP
jgi:hypothetical protein